MFVNKCYNRPSLNDQKLQGFLKQLPNLVIHKETQAILADISESPGV